MKKLSLIDLAFLVVETRDSPKHVAGLMILQAPAGAKRGYAKRLYEELQAFARPREPFNQVIDFMALGGPRWKPAEAFDLDHHLFYHRPDAPLERSGLYDLVAELHTPPLDRSRPLWEFHIIDRLDDGRFAIYSKIHHAYADGVTLTNWTAESLEESPRQEGFRPIWCMRPGRRRRRARGHSSAGLLLGLLKGSINQVRITGGLARLGVQLALEQVGLTKNAVSLPFRTFERTPLTGQVTAPRQFAKASVPMEQINRIREMCRASLNHVALTCVDGALRQYLRDTGNDVSRPIAIQMPVSLRAKGDTGGGNKIGLITVDLASNTDDPYERLREIGFTLRNVRNQIDSVPAASVQQYSIILGVAAQLTELLRLNNMLPAISDTVVSNVPGPREFLYLKDSRVDEMCPVSTLLPGSHLNITLFSYAGTLEFGLVASRELGDLERLAGYIEQAFVDLEEAVFNPPRKRRRGKRRRSDKSG
jgi:WS/DGAT/MGAT family acyltransferase